MLQFIQKTKLRAEIPFTGFPLYRETEDVICDKLEEIIEKQEEILKLLKKLEDKE